MPVDEQKRPIRLVMPPMNEGKTTGAWRVFIGDRELKGVTSVHFGSGNDFGMHVLLDLLPVDGLVLEESKEE